MVNRIQEILSRLNLSASKLADQLDVPRSTISHILSGRNKPSLEFIQKVLARYPDISVNWLLKGEGNFYNKEKNLFSGLHTSNEPEFSDSDPQKDILPHENTKQVASDTEEEKYDNLRKENGEKNDLKAASDHAFHKNDESENTQQKIKPNSKSQKKIIKLIAFYEDHTFEEFFPSNSE